MSHTRTHTHTHIYIHTHTHTHTHTYTHTHTHTGRCPLMGRVEDVCDCPQPTHFNYNSDQLLKTFHLVGTPTDEVFVLSFFFRKQKHLDSDTKSLVFFKVGLGIFRTNADSQWNPVYNVFHRNFCCGNETIRRYFCTRDLDAAKLRPALEQSCGKQMPNDRKLFFRANLLYVPNIKM